MDANPENKLLLKEEVYQIVGSAIDRVTDAERGQILNYLRITKLRVGVILNFKKPEIGMGTYCSLISVNLCSLVV